MLSCVQLMNVVELNNLIVICSYFLTNKLQKVIFINAIGSAVGAFVKIGFYTGC